MDGGREREKGERANDEELQDQIWKKKKRREHMNEFAALDCLAHSIDIPSCELSVIARGQRHRHSNMRGLCPANLHHSTRRACACARLSSPSSSSGKSSRAAARSFPGAVCAQITFDDIQSADRRCPYLSWLVEQIGFLCRAHRSDDG